MTAINITALRALLTAMDGDGATMQELIATSGLSQAQVKRILATARAEFGMAFRVERPDWRYQATDWGVLSPDFAGTGRSPWRPIETAPKNGTRILCWYPHSCNTFATAWDYYAAGKTWILDDGEKAILDHGWPTLWMPMPLPPTA